MVNLIIAILIIILREEIWEMKALKEELKKQK